MIILHKDPSSLRTIGELTRGPKNMWATKDKIIYVADLLTSIVKTPIIIHVLCLLMTHDGKKTYVPRPGT